MSHYNGDVERARRYLELADEVHEEGGSAAQEQVEIAHAVTHAVLALVQAVDKLTSEVRR